MRKKCEKQISLTDKTIDDITEAAEKCRKESYVANSAPSGHGRSYSFVKKAGLILAGAALCLYVGAKTSDTILGIENYVASKFYSERNHDNQYKNTILEVDQNGK